MDSTREAFINNILNEVNTNELQQGQEGQGQGQGAQEIVEPVTQQNENVDTKNVVEPTQTAPSEKNETIAELISKFARQEKTSRGKTDKLKNENQLLRAELDNMKIQISKISDDPISYFDEKNPEMYRKWTERKIGDVREPIDKMQESLDSLRQENKKLIDELSGKVKSFEVQTLVSNYQKSISEVAADVKYSTARKYYEARGLDIVNEAMDFADAYAGRFKKGISPQEAIGAVSDYAKKEIDVSRKFLSSIEPTKEGTAANSGSQTKVKPGAVPDLTATLQGNMVSPKAFSANKTRKQIIQEILDEE